MAQSYSSIPSTTQLTTSLPLILARDDAASSCFSGTAFPSANLLLGMLCYRTDQQKLYQLTNLTGPVWTLVYDLSSGSMVAAVASAVPWSGVSGKPSTLGGYGITDALSKAGDTATGKINFVTPTASTASIRLPHGVAPSAPADGDVWSTTAGFFVRQAGATFEISCIDQAEVFTAKKTFAASGTGAASANIPAGSAPTTPVDGDVWATTTVLNYRMAGVTRSVVFADQLGALATLSTVSAAQIAAGAVDGTKIAIGSDAQGDILYRGATAWTRLPAGTAGQFLQSGGAGANPVWASPSSGALTQGSALTITGAGGSAQGFTALPAGITRIFLTLRAVVTGSITTDRTRVRLGTGGASVTSGYTATAARNDGSANAGTGTTGFEIWTPLAAGQRLDGVVELVNVSGNVWACSYNLASGGSVLNGGGSVDLGGTLDRVVIHSFNGWASGTINIAYS